MKTTALIEKGKDGSFTIFTPDIKSTIIGEGETVLEAKADFENTVKEVLETYEETGEPIPEELQNITFEYKYDMPSFLNCYNYLNMTKLADRAGINPSLMRQYKRGQYVSEKQASKIQEAVHKIGRELLAIRLV
ncbi:MAG: type II toxin-antitoxin system HicB family antitoxin [Bacteroidales bacterium]|nr:type II toxin-antitoxin system HicB family antitoxin [Bacteroidales bacterium]